MDIAAWLRGLGLERYEEAFRDNEIDAEILPRLTSDDLREIGVTAVGNRRKLLDAIEALERETEPAKPEPPATAAARSEAERRQLTVMFVDLVGSTALSTELDPEDMREVLRAYQETCADVVGRFDGHIAKYIGDGLLVYFGYPRAHEDDARRAVSAGLGIVGSIESLNRRLADDYGVDLGVRVGIHTGLVVAGEMGGGATREADAIVGETPNVAARLEGLAAPNTVVISAATHRLVEGLFECDDLGPHQLKGVTQPVSIFQARLESDARSRFEAAAKRGLTPLVGRGSEIDLLLDRWTHAKDGEGQAVLLSGGAGIGKSRILRAIRERLENEDHSRILYYCSAFYQNSALHPVIEQIERVLRFDPSDGVEEKLSKLEGILTELSLPVSECAPLLASLLSLPVGGRYPAVGASPQLLRRKTLEALLLVIETMAAVRPVLMVVEDAHWADPSTLEFLGLLIERLPAARVLLLVNSRPEFEPPWVAHAHVTALRLNRLSRKESADLVRRVAGKNLPDEVFEQIMERSDGVPLYVEELTKSVLESNILTEEDDRYRLEGPLPPFAVPTSLQDSLMARLDRLAPVKEVAQLAATLGRTFSYQLLAAVSTMESSALEAALLQLEDAELIYRRRVGPDLTFEFKHALVQDAAYGCLLKRSRQQHHARIAQVLGEKFSAIADAQPEVLAHHYTEAGLPEPAADHWHKAGRRAMQRSAHVEAERHLRKGLEVLEAMPDGPERRRQEITLQNTLGVCLMPTRGFGSRDVAEAFSKAASISEQEGDSRGLFVALRGEGQYQMISGDLRTARKQARRILTLAEELDDPGLLIEAHHLGWSALTFTADFDAARKHTESGIALYDRDRHHHLTYVYSGHDPGVCCRSFGSLALWQLGYPDQALAACEEGLALARELSHPFSVTIALWAMGMLRLLRRENSATLETGEALIAHCSEKGFPPFIPMGKIFRGGALAEQGDVAEGITELADGIAGVRKSGTEYTLPLFFARLGEVSGMGGRIEEGLGAVEQGLALAERTADGFSLPEFHRIGGELLLARSAGDADQAGRGFTQAIELARQRGGKSLELRAAISLARLWAEQGERQKARDLLMPAYAWFTEGFDTADLKDARTLLDQLT